MDKDHGIDGFAATDMDTRDDLGAGVDDGPKPTLALNLADVDMKFIHLEIFEDEVMKVEIMKQTGMLTSSSEPAL